MACVVGDIHILRPLALAGVRCAVMAQPDDPVRYSRFASHVLDWVDPGRLPERFVGQLLQFAAAQAEPPVLFFEADAELLCISRAREELSRAFRFVLAGPALVEDLVDKARFDQLAKRLDLPVPLTRQLQPGRHTNPDLLDLLLPILVKPFSRTDRRWADIAGPSKALRVSSRDELEALWGRLATTGLAVLAQQLVPGPETRIESYHVYVDAQGNIRAEFTGQKIRTYPAEYGQSTALQITDTADVASLGRDVIRRLGLRGVAKLDFKRAPDGRLYLLEANPRFTLWHDVGAAAGVNIPAMVYRDLIGQPDLAPGRARPGVRWCSPFSDLRAARDWGVPRWRWLAWMLGCEVKGNLALSDPMPLVRGTFDRLHRAHSAHA